MQDRKELSRMGNARHFKFPYKNIFHHLECSAKRKNIYISLTYEEFLKFTETHECSYCGNKVVWIKHGRKASAYNLDRIDNSKGYEKHNLVVCCWRCNNIKSNLISHEEFKKMSLFFKKFLSQDDLNRNSFLELNDLDLND